MSAKQSNKGKIVFDDPEEIPIWVEAKPGGGPAVPYAIYFVHTNAGNEYHFRSDMGDDFEKIRKTILDALGANKPVKIKFTFEIFVDQESIAESSKKMEAPYRSEPFRYYRITDVA